MNPRQDLVETLALRALFTKPCWSCAKELPMKRPAYAHYQYLSNSGACWLFYCEDCMDRLYPERETPRRVSSGPLPLP